MKPQTPCTILKKPQVDAVISAPKSFANRVLISAQKAAMPKEVRVMASMICHMAEHRGTRKQPTPPTARLQCMSLRVNKYGRCGAFCYQLRVSRRLSQPGIY